MRIQKCYLQCRGVCKYYIGPIGKLSLSTATAAAATATHSPARNWLSMYSFFAQKWYGLLSFWALSWLRAIGCFSELLLADGGGGDVHISNNCFLQQNTTASLLELYFNDSMQTMYARGGGGSQQIEVADGADVVFTDTVQCSTQWHITRYAAIFIVANQLNVS